jgi:hypothetical protein
MISAPVINVKCEARLCDLAPDEQVAIGQLFDRLAIIENGQCRFWFVGPSMVAHFPEDFREDVVTVAGQWYGFQTWAVFARELRMVDGPWAVTAKSKGNALLERYEPKVKLKEGRRPADDPIKRRWLYLRRSEWEEITQLGLDVQAIIRRAIGGGEK